MIFSVYLLGICTGIVLTMLVGMIQHHRQEKAKLKIIQALKKEAKALYAKWADIQGRLDVAQEITNRQLDIVFSLEQPQRNSMDGRHRQRLSTELKRLEEEKLAVLQSILKDGHDPKLTVVNMNGDREIVHLSEFLQRSKVNESSGQDAQPAQQTLKSRLTLVKDDKDK